MSSLGINDAIERVGLYTRIKGLVIGDIVVDNHILSVFNELIDNESTDDLNKIEYDLRMDSPLYKSETFWKLLKLSSIICDIELARLEGKYEVFPEAQKVLQVDYSNSARNIKG